MDKPTDWRSGTRRIFSNEFKLHRVELASKPNANVAQLAREHGVDNNQGSMSDQVTTNTTKENNQGCP